MALLRFNVFPSFEEAMEGQQYDHFYQKAVGLATVTGIDLEIIRENNLHILQDGVFPLENYVVENNIEVIDKELYRQALEYWKNTIAWSEYYRLGNEFFYIKDHSDRSYTVKELDLNTLTKLDDSGNDIINNNFDI
jgi:hypothetical protein